MQLTLDENFLFMTDYSGGLRVIDVRNKYSPYII